MRQEDDRQMEAKKVLFITQEIMPYLPESEIAAICRNLPQGIQERGREIRTFMPKYGNINERRNQLHEVIRLSGMNLIIDDTDHPLIIKVASIQSARMQVYFIDNDDYFLRHAAKELETQSHFHENDERAIFFVRGVLETVKKLRWAPSMIHCTGWMSALTPLYLKKLYADDPVFANTSVIYSLFDNSFEGNLSERLTEKMKMDGFADEDIAPMQGQTDHNALNRLAIAYADAIALSSENIHPDLVAYAQASGKPVLEYPGQGNHQAYREFYSAL